MNGTVLTELNGRSPSVVSVWGSVYGTAKEGSNLAGPYVSGLSGAKVSEQISPTT